MASAEVTRKTGETDIKLSLKLDGTGVSKVNSGCGFLDHMLTLFAKHGRFDLDLTCKGDVEVDYHHSVEDIGICLGKAFRLALGNGAGMNRYGSMLLPMDEALVLCAVDVSGRDCLVYNAAIPTAKVGDFDTELVEEFMQAFTRTAGINLHLIRLKGTNTHHIIEGVYKALARALAKALTIDEKHKGELPSTKGVL